MRQIASVVLALILGLGMYMPWTGALPVYAEDRTNEQEAQEEEKAEEESPVLQGEEMEKDGEPADDEKAPEEEENKYPDEKPEADRG